MDESYNLWPNLGILLLLPLRCYLAIMTLPFIVHCFVCRCRLLWQWTCTRSYLCIRMFVSMGAWFRPMPPPLLVFLTWLIGRLIDTSQKLWPLVLNLALCVLTQCHRIKVATFYLFRPLFAWFVLPWLIKASLFCDLGQLGMPNWSINIFEPWAYFQLLGARDRYKALTILRLSPR